LTLFLVMQITGRFDFSSKKVAPKLPIPTTPAPTPVA
jgi:hypothetical protein